MVRKLKKKYEQQTIHFFKRIYTTLISTIKIFLKIEMEEHVFIWTIQTCF